MSNKQLPKARVATRTTPEATLRAEGWVLLPRILSPTQVAALHDMWDAFADADDELAEPPDDQTLRSHPAVAPCLSSVQVTDHVRALLGDDFVLLGIRGRSPAHGRGQQGLHVDAAGKVKPDEQKLVNVFFALNDMDAANGATRLVPGTHRTYELPTGTYGQPHGHHPAEIFVSAAAGDVLLFTSHLWHSGSRNESGRQRRVLIVQYGRERILWPSPANVSV
ncbi:MAG: phytanoyl-CoA dioxygenase family protein [Gammaproteobacteria bacterium]|nr:phytanoyl-CoA dioxygenase family protein [Gammaproteobacteria bacterium]